MIFLFIALNAAISWFNAWSVGRGWVEARAAGGVARFMAWMGAIMAAVGFTYTYFAILGMICLQFKLLPPLYIQGFFSLRYLIIIIPALGSGLAITIQSWAHFYKQRTLGNGAVAGWNSFAQILNTYQAMSAIPEAFGNVLSMFDSKKSKDKDDSDVQTKLILLVVLLAVAATVGGVLTARAIILRSARNVADEYPQLRAVR